MAHSRFALRPGTLTALMTALFAAVLPHLTGCGGGGGAGGAPQTGQARITVAWPTRSRLVPAASNSVRAILRQDGQEVGSAVLVRPAAGGQTTATIENAPAGSLTLVATAYPNTDATGVAQATGTTPVTITGGQTTDIQLAMESTIDHLEIAPGASASVAVGETLPLTVTAKDATGNVVLTSPGKIQWSSASTALASVDSGGVVTGVAPTGSVPGPVQLTVTETESGKTAGVALTVTSSATVTVSPSAPTLSVGDPQPFGATVSNAPNTAVTWGVQEGAAGGSITPSGTYTAPATPGTYHVVATSNYDNSKQAVATVTVQSGNANLVIK
jgi:hypothetical protein